MRPLTIQFDNTICSLCVLLCDFRSQISCIVERDTTTCFLHAIMKMEAP